MIYLARESKRRKKIYAKFTQPSHFDYDLIVVGAGPGGIEAARTAANYKAKVLLVEKKKLGGDSLHNGSVPSKALLRGSQVAHLFRRGHEFGMQEVAPQVDFSRVFTRLHKVIERATPSLEGLGIELMSGEAKIADPFRVHVDQKILTTRNIIIATGTSPAVPEIPGLGDVVHYSSETLWQLQRVPKRLLVMGGGPTGCELAQAFARLGCETTLVEQRSTLLRKEDPEVAEMVLKRFQAEGIKVHLSTEITQFERHGDGGRATLKNGEALTFDAVLVGLGRRPRINGFGVDELKIDIRRDGTIETDGFQRTNFSNIYAVGDVAGPFQFTHAAVMQGQCAALNALFSPARTFRADYTAIPWCTFVDPEIARVGFNELLAKEARLDYDLHLLPFAHIDRALCDAEEGLIKVLTAKGGGGKILGVTVVGAHASDTIGEFVLAMRKDLSLEDILETVHIYPSFADGNRLVANVWKTKSGPPLGLKFLMKYRSSRPQKTNI